MQKQVPSKSSPDVLAALLTFPKVWAVRIPYSKVVGDLLPALKVRINGGEQRQA
jgi:hypothetical protein